jgi:hypothetical protein
MTEDDIPAFVDAMIAAGADIRSPGEGLYVIGDADIPDLKARQKLYRIIDSFGPRDHLRHQIAAHLRSIGRQFELHSSRPTGKDVN